MFTGIVEEKGKIVFIEQKRNLIVLGVKGKKVNPGTKIGDSIAVDGVCLTVTKRRKGALCFDVMKETIEKTTLKLRKPSDEINLERSLKADGRIGGHFVFGHVDCVGQITGKDILKNYVKFHVSIPKDLAKYIVPKGSIAIDGISLTVGEVKGETFSAYIIPHTLKITTLGVKRPQDKVNIETDVLAKYLLKHR